MGFTDRTMKPNQTLHARIKTLEHDLQHTYNELDALERNCDHIWGDTETDHVEHKGYTLPADGAGSDFRPSRDVAPRQERRWKRTCTECGKVEHTTKTKERVTKIPEF